MYAILRRLVFFLFKFIYDHDLLAFYVFLSLNILTVARIGKVWNVTLLGFREVSNFTPSEIGELSDLSEGGGGNGPQRKMKEINF